jgi:hypothetical protein
MTDTTRQKPRTRTLILLKAHGTMLGRMPASLWLGPALADWRFGARRTGR